MFKAPPCSVKSLSNSRTLTNTDTNKYRLCRFPATFTFVLRAFATLEGIGRALDANYKFVAVAQPYATKLLDLQVGHRPTCNSVCGVCEMLCPQFITVCSSCRMTLYRA